MRGCLVCVFGIRYVLVVVLLDYRVAYMQRGYYHGMNSRVVDNERALRFHLDIIHTIRLFEYSLGILQYIFTLPSFIKLRAERLPTTRLLKTLT
jgi:hypothetical protein